MSYFDPVTKTVTDGRKSGGVTGGTTRWRDGGGGREADPARYEEWLRQQGGGQPKGERPDPLGPGRGNVGGGGYGKNPFMGNDIWAMLQKLFGGGGQGRGGFGGQPPWGGGRGRGGGQPPWMGGGGSPYGGRFPRPGVQFGPSGPPQGGGSPYGGGFQQDQGGVTPGRVGIGGYKHSNDGPFGGSWVDPNEPPNYEKYPGEWLR